MELKIEKQIILIVGLPGSGKSTLLENDYSNSKEYQVYDDVKANAVLDCGDFTYSKHYPEIIEQLLLGEKNLVISDISFCDFCAYERAHKILLWWIDKGKVNYEIKTEVFEKSSDKCKSNIRRDNNRKMAERINKVDSLFDVFDPSKYVSPSEVRKIYEIV